MNKGSGWGYMALANINCTLSGSSQGVSMTGAAFLASMLILVGRGTLGIPYWFIPSVHKRRYFCAGQLSSDCALCSDL
jgi:hypothetical protein